MRFRLGCPPLEVRVWHQVYSWSCCVDEFLTITEENALQLSGFAFDDKNAIAFGMIEQR